MRWCTNRMARILRTFRVITTETTSPILPGTNFHRITRRSSGGSTNGFTAWKISELTWAKLGKPILTSSSRSLIRRRRSITEGIDERSRLFGVGDDDRGGGADVDGRAHRIRRRRSPQY